VSKPPLPSAIERLVDELGSVGTLELLLLLRDAAPSGMSLADVCAGLRCPVSWAELQLRRLRDADFVEGDPAEGFVYSPGSPGLAVAADELAALWEDDRRAITSRMLESPRARRRARSGLH
jgi:DNA-binding IclR family transcriptional regulator